MKTTLTCFGSFCTSHSVKKWTIYERFVLANLVYIINVQFFIQIHSTFFLYQYILFIYLYVKSVILYICYEMWRIANTFDIYIRLYAWYSYNKFRHMISCVTIQKKCTSFPHVYRPYCNRLRRYGLYIWFPASLLCLDHLSASFLTYTWAINRSSSTRWKFSLRN